MLGSSFRVLVVHIFFISNRHGLQIAIAMASISFLPPGALLYTKELGFEHLVGVGWIFVNTCFSVLLRLLQRRMLAADQDPVDISKAPPRNGSGGAGCGVKKGGGLMPICCGFFSVRFDVKKGGVLL